MQPQHDFQLAPGPRRGPGQEDELEGVPTLAALGEVDGAETALAHRGQQGEASHLGAGRGQEGLGLQLRLLQLLVPAQQPLRGSWLCFHPFTHAYNLRSEAAWHDSSEQVQKPQA